MTADTLSGILQVVVRILAASWWFLLPALLLPVFLNFWLLSRQFNFISKIKWKILEIKIPKEILKSPKAMELVFSSVYSIHDTLKFADKWWKGQVQYWMSFELVGHAGGVHFYVRLPAQFHNMLESAIYSQYPEVEIVEVEDYVDLMPSVLPNKIYDFWGNNFVLVKPDAYPIRTYEYFEEHAKEKRLDPMAVITEAASKAKEDEMVWIQLIVRPVGPEWKKEGQKLINKLISRKEATETTLMGELGEFFVNLVKAPFSHPTWSEGGSEASLGEIMSLTPGEKDVVAAIENKISKLAFESLLRFIYIDKADKFSKGNVSSVLGAFRQFNTLNLNAFKLESATATKADPPFKARKIYIRKRRIYDCYRLRLFSLFANAKKPPIMNIEELATLYHFPTTIVEAPTLHRLESRRGEPPAELPIE